MSSNEIRLLFLRFFLVLSLTILLVTAFQFYGDPNSSFTMVETALETFGKLDCAYNNVGIHAPVLPSGDLELSEFIKVLNVNLVGCFSCMKYELKAMEKFGKGAIVNCSSQSGIVGTAGLSAYTASKHGVIGMTKCAGLEYAKKGIRVNAICPGTCDTPMVAKASAASPEHMKKIIADIPFGRMGRPEEIAEKVLFLCSDLAEFMVGQVLVADGGFTVP